MSLFIISLNAAKHSVIAFTSTLSTFRLLTDLLIMTSNTASTISMHIFERYSLISTTLCFTYTIDILGALGISYEFVEDLAS